LKPSDPDVTAPAVSVREAARGELRFVENILSIN
jgi:hypothetical protein